MTVPPDSIVQVCNNAGDSCQWIPVSDLLPALLSAFSLTPAQGAKIAMAFWGLLATVYVLKKLRAAF